MMKIFLVLIASLMSLSAFAREVPKEQIDTYKDAAKIALADAKLDQCGATSANSIIDSATKIEVSSNGAQPLLVFSFGYGYDQVVDFKITTTSNFKTAVAAQIYITKVETAKINVGNLENPEIVTTQRKSSTVYATCGKNSPNRP